jgi:hypothetical protein
MAKRQSRRSVSVRGVTYEQIRRYCERIGISMSEFVEARIADYFGNGGLKPLPVTTRSSAKERLSPDQLKDAARYFTF